MSATDAPRGSADALAVAAPPAAARALAQLDHDVGRPLRHVVVVDAAVAAEEAAGVEVLWRYHLTADQLNAVAARLPALRWVHSDYVGVDGIDLAALARRNITLTNGGDVMARPMAEWVVLAVLAGAKDLPRLVRQSDAGVWDVGPPARTLHDAVVLLLGLGAVGQLAARWLHTLGAEVRAAVRRPRPQLPPGVSTLVTGDAWRRHLPDADVVICAVPLTAATATMLDADAFAAMKPGAWLVNVARGGIVDEAALLDALDAGTLGGAVLDAFVEEPLPPGHPLWGRPDVLVLPHATWSSPDLSGRLAARFAEKLRRFAARQPLPDVVDLAAGY